MDTSMDLSKESEEYKLGLKHHFSHHKKPPTAKQEDVRVTCHMYLALRTSLFLGTSSGMLLMWKPKNEFHAEIVRTDLSGHKGGIFDILFLGDEASSGGGWGHAAGAASLSHLVATCSADRTVKIWDVFERDLKQRCIQTLIGHEGSVTSMTFLRGSLITCSTDNSVRIWRSSPERSLLLYPFFEIVQEIWGPGGSTVPASLAGILGQAPPGAPPPSSVLKSCPFVVGRLVRAEQQLLFVGDTQGRVYTFIPPARGGFGSGPPRQLLKENMHTSDSSIGNSSSTTPRRPAAAAPSSQHTPRKPAGGGAADLFQPHASTDHHHHRAVSIGMSALLGAPTSSTFEFSRSHKIHSLSVSKMLIVHAESLIITLSFDHTVQVHDATSARPPYFGMENPNRCRYLSMDWDSVHQELFLSDEHGFVQVWNIYIEKCLKSVKLKHEPIYSISLHHPQKLLLGTADGVEVWTIQRNVKFNEFKGHEGPVVQMIQINSTSLGMTAPAHIPKTSAQQQQQQQQGQSHGKPNKDGKSSKSSTAGAGGGVGSGPLLAPLSSFVSEEKYLYSASSDYTIRQWDSYDMNCLSIIKERGSEISCMAYLPGSIILATGHDEGVIRLWNIDSGTYMNLRFHKNTISALCVAKTPRQDCLVSASFDRTIAVWDVTKQRAFNPVPEYSLRVSDEEVLCLAYHQQLGLIFTGGNDTLVQMWHIDTRAKEGTFRGHTNAVGCLALDGNFLISGSDDTTIRVWNIHLQYCVCTLGGHELAVRDLLVIPMYGFIVSTAFDGRVIIWDYQIAAAIKQFHHLEKRFRCLLYDAAQRKIFAGTEEARIMFFILPEEMFPVSSAGVGGANRVPGNQLASTWLLGPQQEKVTTATPTEEMKEEAKSPSVAAGTGAVAAGVAGPPKSVPPATAAAPPAVTIPDAFSVAPTAGASPPDALPADDFPSPHEPIDYSAIVQELLQQSLGIQALLSKVQALPPARSNYTVTPAEKRDDRSSAAGAAGGAGGSAAAALKRVTMTPTITAPSQARRASLTNSLRPGATGSTPILSVSTIASKPTLPPELSPPTQNQTLALRRQSLTHGVHKSLTMRPRGSGASGIPRADDAAAAGGGVAAGSPAAPFVPVVGLLSKSDRASLGKERVGPGAGAETGTAARHTQTAGAEKLAASSSLADQAPSEMSTSTAAATATAASAVLSPPPPLHAGRASLLNGAMAPGDGSSGLLSAKRASMLTSANLSDIRALLKPQPASATSEVDASSTAPGGADADGGEAATEGESTEQGDLISPLSSPSLPSASSPGVGLPSLSRSLSSSPSRRASMALSHLSTIAGMLKETPAEAATPVAPPTDSQERPSSLPTVDASPVPSLAIPVASDPPPAHTGDDSTAAASSGTIHRTASTPSIPVAGAAAGDPNAPIPELKASARTNRFSMPSNKGRLEFNV